MIDGKPNTRRKGKQPEQLAAKILCGQSVGQYSETSPLSWCRSDTDRSASAQEPFRMGCWEARGVICSSNNLMIGNEYWGSK